MLGDRQCHASDIDLLKAVAAQEIRADIPRDRDDGNGIHIGRGDPGDQIGRAGAGGGKDDARPARCAGVTIRRVGRPLLMRRQDMTDLVAVFIECVVNIQDRAARIAENGIHALLKQYFHNNLRACFFHDNILPENLLELFWGYGTIQKASVS